MTLSNYIQVCSYAAQISRVIADGVAPIKPDHLRFYSQC